MIFSLNKCIIINYSAALGFGLVSVFDFFVCLGFVLFYFVLFCSVFESGLIFCGFVGLLVVFGFGFGFLNVCSPGCWGTH